jgi:putative phosphoribosyl transferase
MNLFKDRLDAGQKLAEKISLTLEDQDPIILGIPRGGIAVGYPIAKHMHCPLEPITLRKLPIPQNDQMGFGAVTLDRQVILNQELIAAGYIAKREIDAIVDEVYQEVLRRDLLYRGAHPFPDLAGRTVFIVDDGLATGYTMMAAIQFSKRRQAFRIRVAVPVAHAGSYARVRVEVDSITCLHIDNGYSFAVASFYERFPDMRDSEVTALLHELRSDRTDILSGRERTRLE